MKNESQSSSVEFSGKSVEEAIELALRELSVEREEVEVEVLSKGRSGLLGLGGEPARIRVTRIVSSDPYTQAQNLVHDILSLLKVSARAGLKSGPGGASEPSQGAVINIEGEDAGLLIGRKGETLLAFQFLVNIILQHRLHVRIPLTLDVEGYRERRQNALQALALRMAERVASSGRSITLEPMPPHERRIVHIALGGHPRVSTQSVGMGDARKVSIISKRSQPQRQA